MSTDDALADAVAAAVAATAEPTSTVLSIGSNLGDRLATLQGAVDGLGDRVRAVSPVYATAPWGVTDQPEFLNAVVLAEHRGDWLTVIRRLEAAAERTRERRWGPRTLDVDVIAGFRSDDPDLTVPHPRAAQRAFVLVPWLRVDPAATLPGHGPVADLVAALPAAERDGVRERTDLELVTR